MSVSDDEVVSAQTAKPKQLQGLRVVLLTLGIALILGAAFGVRYLVWLRTTDASLTAVSNGDFPRAVSEADNAIRIMSILPDQKSYAQSLRIMFSIYACRRQFVKAARYSRSLLAFDEKSWGRSSAEYANDLGDLALMYRKQRKFAESEKVYREVIALFQKNGTAYDLERARNLAAIAWVLCKQDKFDEALRSISDSDQIFRAKLPENSYERLTGIIEGAYISRQTNKIPQLHADINTAYKIATEPEELEKSSAQTVVGLNLLAQIFEELGKQAQALKMYAIAEQNCESSVFGGSNNIYMVDVLIPHARLLESMGKKVEAKALFERAARIHSLKEPL